MIKNSMARKSDARKRAIETTEKLVRSCGLAASGLARIINESGCPKGSFYFHFPSGKDELVSLMLVEYVERARQLIDFCSKRADGNPQSFVRNLCGALKQDMQANEYALGCALQTVADERSGDQTSLSRVVEEGFASWHAAIRAGFKRNGIDQADCDWIAGAFLGGLQGARTISRAQRSTKPFDDLFRLMTLFVR
jgi:TetR/AcrR family transcriptional regulator, lmrAB and yxaGH operons repressor